MQVVSVLGKSELGADEVLRRLGLDCLAGLDAYYAFMDLLDSFLDVEDIVSYDIYSPFQDDIYVYALKHEKSE